MSGRLSTMITTMDRAGRLVIPREIRREAALEPGVLLDVRWRDGIVEIEPAPLAVTLERRGRVLVATPVAEVPSLRSTIVERARRTLAAQRGPR